MRQITKADDVQSINAILKDIYNQLDRLRTQDLQMSGRKIRNMGKAEKSGDAVTWDQLKELESKLATLEQRVKYGNK